MVFVCVNDIVQITNDSVATHNIQQLLFTQMK